MYKFFYFLVFFIILKSGAQTTAPKSINYQGIARNPSGVPIASTFDIQFEIKDAVNIVHSEIQTAIQPNSLGMFNTQIGLSPNTITLTAWDNGPYFLNVSIKTGSTFTLIGSQALVSVPFSLYASNVASSYTNNILTIGNNSYSIASGSSAITPTINGAGIVTVSPSSGSVFTVYVPTPSLSYDAIGNVLTLTQGAAVSTATLTSSGSSTINMIGAGIANITPTSGSAFTVSVPSPSLNFSGNVLTLTQGSVTSSDTLNPTLGGDVIGTLTTTTVTALQSAPISAIAPTNGQLLSFVSGTWTPTTPTTMPVNPWQKTANNVSLLVSADNVGIGTSVPSSQLEVSGFATTGTSIIKSTNINPANSNAAIEAKSTGTLAMLVNETSAGGGIAGDFSSLVGKAINATSTGIPHTLVSTNNSTSTTAYAGFFDGGIVTKGKSTTSSGTALMVQNSSANNLMVVRNDGFVGLNESSPSTRLHLFGTNTVTIPNLFSASPETALRMHNEDLTNNNFSSLIFSTKASNFANFEGAKIVGQFVDHTVGSIQGDLAFFTRNTTNLNERMRLTGSGMLGIGTNAPTSPLDVIGKTSTDSLQVTSPVAPTTGAILLSRDNSGNTKWSSGPIAFQYNFAPSSNISVTTNTINNLGNTTQFSGALSVSIGGGYNTTNAQFTSPVSGIYEFNASLEVSLSAAAVGNNWIYLEICKNPGSPVVLKRSLMNNQDGSLPTYVVLQANTLANLTAGDVVFIRAVGASGGSGGSITTNNTPNLINSFNGHLLR